MYYQTVPNSEYVRGKDGSESTGDKLRGRKGNNPDHRLRSLNYVKW